MKKTDEMSPTITVRMLGQNDASILDWVAPDVFDQDVNASYIAEFLSDSRHHMAVAMAGELVVGIASAVHYIHPDKPNELWINEVGVSPAYQRRGIGRELLNMLFAHARELGCAEAWLLTEEDNTAARRLYASAGGSEQLTVYVTFDLSAVP